VLNTISRGTTNGTGTAVREASLAENGFALHQNFPNPFNPATTLRCELTSPGFANLKVYNILGVEVTTLVEGQKQAETFVVVWNASQQPSGVYFARLKVIAGSNILATDTKKLILTK
jgi:hypothetical protein